MWWVVADPPSSNSIVSQEKLQTKEPQKDKSRRDPCWFNDPRNKNITFEEIEKRNDLEMHGYPKEIPLGEAIRIFNEEKQCSASLAPYPLLTEDEVIAAIVAGGGYETPGKSRAKRKAALWHIATTKMLPKGSLLVATTGSNVQKSPLRPNGEIKARGISIALFLGMENHQYGEELKPEQIFEIRRTFFSVDTIW
ncbi:MAG: hypothetical protein K1Y36_10695 [Blastocatellia bacterium]|nr:hypothetical protein [Blastocatellia bacterium]